MSDHRIVELAKTARFTIPGSGTALKCPTIVTVMEERMNTTHEPRRVARRATQLLVAASALILVLVMALWRTSAHTASMADMRMSQAPARSTAPVVLKHQRTVRVNIRDLAFKPAHIVVSPGTKIIWTNRDSFQHTTTSDRGLWDSDSINSQAKFVRVFKKAGMYTYHCTIHPFMHGTIAVKK
jgi:plastocyanin